MWALLPQHVDTTLMYDHGQKLQRDGCKKQNCNCLRTKIETKVVLLIYKTKGEPLDTFDFSNIVYNLAQDLYTQLPALKVGSEKRIETSSTSFQHQQQYTNLMTMIM